MTARDSTSELCWLNSVAFLAVCSMPADFVAVARVHREVTLTGIILGGSNVAAASGFHCVCGCAAGIFFLHA
jgi:hypothetical protein